MAQRKQFKMSVAQRQRRHFSESFKKEKVRDVELGLIRVSELCREYEVSSTSVYRWINKYGKNSTNNPPRLIMENKSDTKKIVELRKKVAELERLIGQKQIVIDFQDKLIDLAEQEYGIDIKKKCSGKPSSTIGKIEKK